MDQNGNFTCMFSLSTQHDSAYPRVLFLVVSLELNLSRNLQHWELAVSYQAQPATNFVTPIVNFFLNISSIDMHFPCHSSCPSCFYYARYIISDLVPYPILCTNTKQMCTNNLCCLIAYDIHITKINFKPITHPPHLILIIAIAIWKTQTIRWGSNCNQLGFTETT